MTNNITLREDLITTKICPACNGKKFIGENWECIRCLGTGQVPDTHIPNGTDTPDHVTKVGKKEHEPTTPTQSSTGGELEVVFSKILTIDDLAYERAKYKESSMSIDSSGMKVKAELKAELQTLMLSEYKRGFEAGAEQNNPPDARTPKGDK